MKKPLVLKSAEIRTQLKRLSGWKYAKNKLSKELAFKSFPKAMHFIYGLAPYFEKMDHHADMHVYYKKVVFELTRFDAGNKVTDRDIEVAREIEDRFKKLKK